MGHGDARERGRSDRAADAWHHLERDARRAQGERLLAAAAGVAFEVVPGVSSAIAAPALAGIPVTHRGLAAAVVVVSGHAEAAYRPVLASLAPQSATVVVLMGLGSRAAIADVLRGRGWPAATPAAIVRGASTEDEQAWIGTLDGLGAAAVEGDAPGTLVVGAVVSLAATIGAARAADGASEIGGTYAARG